MQLSDFEINEIKESFKECFIMIRKHELRFQALDNLLSDIEPRLHIRYVQEYNELLKMDKVLLRLKE